jgi:hypothetical protein
MDRTIKEFLRPSVKSKFHQGYYTPKNLDKYKGDPTKIIYRSSWEKKFMYWLDTTDAVIEWSSEGLSVKYWSELDNKIHTYYPDFHFVYIRDGEALKYIVEVKPHSQLSKPRQPSDNSAAALKRYKMRLENYIRISCKTKAVKKWCQENGYKFVFLTEKSNLI